MTDMALVDAPFGLVPWGDVKQVNYYAIQTTPTTVIFHGDLMERAAGALATPHMGPLLEAVVEEQGAGGSLLGAVVGLFNHQMKPVLSFATTDAGDGVIAGYVAVADHPDQEYVIAEDGDTSSIAAASIGLNVDCVSTHAGSATTGMSKMELDSSSIDVTATLALKILRSHPEDTISAAGAAGNHCRFIVKLNSAHRGVASLGI